VAFCLHRRCFREALEFKYFHATQYAESVQPARALEES
jgi:hypothetical protein